VVQNRSSKWSRSAVMLLPSARSGMSIVSITDTDQTGAKALTRPRRAPHLRCIRSERRALQPICAIVHGSIWRIICPSVLYIAYCLTLLCPIAFAQGRGDPLALPRMEPCRNDSHPLLPSKWRGVFLMAPFTPTQLVLSEFFHDGTLPATLVNLYGVRSGSIALFVIGNKTYALSGNRSDLSCEELGDARWLPLPRDLLAEGAQCVGSAPISETSVEWWKIPIQPAPLADWVWFKASDRTPFRLLFEHPGDHLAVLSSFAFSYQVSFESLAETNLATIAASCARARRAMHLTAMHGVLDAMRRSRSRADAEIKRLFPEIDVGCPPMHPRWPDALGMTMFLTPLNIGYNPVPAEVLYSWKLRAQRTRMFWPADSPFVNDDALMLAAHGYSVIRKRTGAVQCIPSLPGTPRPEWLREAPCSCEATIDAATPLTPYGPVQILRCPATPPRLFWTWHTAAGRPMTFMVTPSRGDEPTALITLADYYAWVPGYASDESAFARPTECGNLPLRSRTNLGPPGAQPAEPCGRCHLTPDKPR